MKQCPGLYPLKRYPYTLVSEKLDDAIPLFFMVITVHQ